jgi:rare lipoprotein A
MTKKTLALAFVLIPLLAACSSGGGSPDYKGSYGKHHSRKHSQKDGDYIKPTPDVNVKIGKPYRIGGDWYTPKYDRYYDEVGVASWYGPGFHGNQTANGERFDQHDMTAAHRTLPMPSFVRVDNLENGRSAILRVNDRGPFAKNRIIDLSKAAADKLGVIGAGTARVRVRYLSEETERYIASRGREVPDPDAVEVAAMDTLPVRPVQEFKPVPMQQANDSKAEGETAPLISVKESFLPPLIRQANAAEATPAGLPGQQMAMVKVEEEEEEEEKQVASIPADSDQSSAFDVLNHKPAQPGKFTPPAAVDKTSSAPATLPNWAVQVASFAQKGNAESMVSRLQAIGRPSLREVTVNGQPYYRVLVWPADLSTPQHKLLADVRDLGIPDAKIITNLQ